MTENQPTDYAAILRALHQTPVKPPDWLSVSKHVYSPEYGVGEIMALLGKRLIVKFIEEVNPTQFTDWEVAITQGQIQQANTYLELSTYESEKSDLSATNALLFQQIPELKFQAIALELASSIVVVDIKNAFGGIVHPIPTDLPPHLRIALASCGITQLYSHQLEALKKLRAGFDLSLVTPTASKKNYEATISPS